MLRKGPNADDQVYLKDGKTKKDPKMYQINQKIHPNEENFSAHNLNTFT